MKSFFLKLLLLVIGFFLAFNLLFANNNPYFEELTSDQISKIDKIVLSISYKKMQYDDSKFASFSNDIISKLDKIKSKYESNLEISNIIDYIIFEINQIKETDFIVDGITEDKLEKIMCSMGKCNETDYSQYKNLTFGNCDIQGEKSLFYNTGNSCDWAAFECKLGKYYLSSTQYNKNLTIPNTNSKLYDTLNSCEISEKIAKKDCKVDLVELAEKYNTVPLFTTFFMYNGKVYEPDSNGIFTIPSGFNNTISLGNKSTKKLIPSILNISCKSGELEVLDGNFQKIQEVKTPTNTNVTVTNPTNSNVVVSNPIGSQINLIKPRINFISLDLEKNILKLEIKNFGKYSHVLLHKNTPGKTVLQYYDLEYYSNKSEHSIVAKKISGDYESAIFEFSLTDYVIDEGISKKSIIVIMPSIANYSSESDSIDLGDFVQARLPEINLERRVSDEGQYFSWTTQNAESLSWSCKSSAGDVKSSANETLNKKEYFASWASLNKSGWVGDYECTWSAKGNGLVKEEKEFFSIKKVETVSLGNSFPTYSLNACNNKQSFIVVSGIEKTFQNKICITNKTDNRCNNLSNFNITNLEWISDKTIRFSIPENKYTQGYYDIYIMDNNITKKIGDSIYYQSCN